MQQSYICTLALLLLVSCASNTKSSIELFDQYFPPEDKYHPKTELLRLHSRSKYIEIIRKAPTQRAENEVKWKLINSTKEILSKFRQDEERMYINKTWNEIETRIKAKIGYYLLKPSKGTQEYINGALAAYIAQAESFKIYPLDEKAQSFLIAKGLKSLITNAILPGLLEKIPIEGNKFLEESGVGELLSTEEYSLWMAKMKQALK